MKQKNEKQAKKLTDKTAKSDLSHLNKVLDVKFVPVKDIKLNAKNRNVHPSDQIERLKKIIEYQGFRTPLTVSNRTGLLVAGHGRLIAAKRLGMKIVPVIYQDFVSDEQEIAHGISDNAIALWSTLDMDGINIDVSGFSKGFDTDFLGMKNFSVSGAVVGKCDEDEVPTLPKKAKTKLGDIYQLGTHRLMCCDSTNPSDIEKLMAGERADMVFTDPPYQLETKGGGLLKESSAMKAINKLGIDNFDPSTLTSMAMTSVFCCNKPLIEYYIKLAKEWGVSWDLAIYHKQNVVPNYGGHLMTDIEYIFVIGKQSPKTGLNEPKELYSKLYSGGKDQDNETAWSKPVALCEKFIKLYSDKTVLDVFGGSGSTLIACEKNNRRCFMAELSPHYVSIIVERWCKYTGKMAYRLNENGTQTAWSKIKTLE